MRGAWRENSALFLLLAYHPPFLISPCHGIASRQQANSLLLLTFSGSSQASSFKPECTMPPPGTSYVAGKNARGTTAILFNCVSIIPLCTWNIQRLNITAARPKAKGYIQSIWWGLLNSRSKVKWMIITVLVSEHLVRKAFGELIATKVGVDEMKDVRISSQVSQEIGESRAKGGTNAITTEPLQWEEVHASMVNMGYFVVDFGEALDDPKGMKALLLQIFEYMLIYSTATKPFEVLVDEAPGFTDYFSTKLTLSRLRHRSWTMNNLQVLSALEAVL